MRRETGFGQGRNGRINGRGVLAGSKPRGSHARLVDDDSLDRVQRLRDALDAGAAMHPIDVQHVFRHDSLLFVFDDTPDEKLRYRRGGTTLGGSCRESFQWRRWWAWAR